MANLMLKFLCTSKLVKCCVNIREVVRYTGLCYLLHLAFLSDLAFTFFFLSQTIKTSGFTVSRNSGFEVLFSVGLLKFMFAEQNTRWYD